MYESQNKDSLWKPYFDILPSEFDTPMFWNDIELNELMGSGVIDKIGKDDAEKAFNEYLLPIIQAKPSLFDPEVHNLQLFHRMGSLIMSNAFHDDKNQSEEDEDSGEEDGKKGTDEEARLFREEGLLQMMAIKKISKGEQFNTYGDLCSADLLRKYGFVDENNDHDIVEINGKLVIDALSVDEDIEKEKVELLLEEEVLDDLFVLDTSGEIPPELIITVMMMNKTQFKPVKKTGILPEPVISIEIIQPLVEILEKRLSDYKTSIPEDEEILKGQNISLRMKYAVMLRLSEKRILQKHIDDLRSYKVKDDNEEG
ncbi:10999_t:CDS:10, partial [Acaulospora colombiana]